MKGSQYVKGFREAVAAAAVQKYANVTLAVALLIALVLAFNQRERVVVVPPVVNDQFEVGYDSANAHYYEAWSLYVATFLGNINPANSTFVVQGLERAFTPDLYTTMRQQILEQAEDLRISGRSLRFYPDRVIFEKQSSKTFVTGKQEIVSSNGAVKEQEVVYEMLVRIRDGLPMVAQFDFYPGAPRTVEWLAKHGTDDGAT
jgi:conjugal transfer pilus assembly protein TraE